MSFKNISKFFLLITICLLSTEHVSAQDLLARQAPVDRKAKAVDTLALQRIIEREMEENPSFSLYEEWSNSYAHKVTEVPDTFKIDLRHFSMPSVSRVITSNFGWRKRRDHKGLDVKVYVGDTIRAAFSGKVRIVDYERRGYGKYVIIRHNNGLETVYGHLSKQLVAENQIVRAGEVIGLGGNTGRSTGSHLHFETRLCGIALNPALLFDFHEQDVTGDYYIFRKDTYKAEGKEATKLRGVRNKGRYTPEDVRGTALASNDNTNTEVQEEAIDQPQYHKVRKGETLSVIAKKRGTTINRLCKLNNLTTRSKLQIGMILRYS